MSDIAIKVEGIGKEYKIGRKKSGDLRESFTHFLDLFSHSPTPKPQSPNPQPLKTFWALKDISFEVKQGEAVGIIGRNGAGKSTLLKVLSRITRPTTGRFEINGRVSSLLEVGTGFHPELTGRENIYLNGTILGMKRREIKSKFDEIVAFSGVEEFIDTPVKHYSSGMKVRLAFSVAAHLEPEILIIDEVLAVGDAEFQKKCLGKMEDVTSQGRTVLFVSHNMGAVRQLCQRGVLLNSGLIEYLGNQEDTVQNYLKSRNINATNDLLDRKDRIGTGELMVTAIKYYSEDGVELDSVYCGQSFNIQFCIIENKKVKYDKVIVSILIKNMEDQSLSLIHNRMTGYQFSNLNIGCHINKIPLLPGKYGLTYSIMLDGQYIDSLRDAISLQVISGNYYSTSELPPISASVFLLDAKWHD